MSGAYQAETRISVDDVHYAPISPGERELKLLGDVAGQRVLELACGAAQNSIAMAKWGAHVTALDLSARQLHQARRLVSQAGVTVHLLRGDMERLEMFRDPRFDIILSSFGIEFVPDLATCLAGCHRVLREGGMLVVSTVHPLAAFEWDEVEQGLTVTDYFHLPVEVWEEPSDGGRNTGMTFFHTVHEVFELLVECGFRVERILEPYPYPLHTMSKQERADIPYSGSFWETQYDRFRKVPFAIIYTARKL